jgi:hypothetical protein
MVLAPYARVMQQLFRGLRDRDDTECHTALDVICRVARVPPGMPETRLPRLRHALRDARDDANDFVIEVVTRLADAHVCAGPSDGAEAFASSSQRTGEAGRRTILLVDEDPDVLRMLSASLSASGFAVRLARSGDEALLVLGGNIKVDAMVAGHAMVGMDGVELLAEAA